MITFSREYLKDRILACWLGKSIGGTLGTPYEGTRDMLNITGFASKAGEPLPNDDLDLQLVWLRAVDEMGPQNITSQVLGEYWMTYINPNWNEYGVGKANMRDGILPPMSGEINNDEWKHSNGAWIRTEIWACLYPALPEKAIRMAFEDASVDHGFGEGTYAAIFIAAMESAAFVISDARELLKIGLSKIPEDCRVARSVRLVMDCFDKGMSWQDCRQAVVQDSEDLGWFQAPGNVAFVVLGLLYGKGDFKQSLIHAVNCGDDTDCTSATLGALLGIMYGVKCIPDDWRAYIGDDIKVACLTYGHGRFPQDCGELTELVLDLLPVTLRRTLAQTSDPSLRDVELSDKTDLTELNAEKFMGRAFVEQLQKRSPYSYTTDGIYASVTVNFDAPPVIAPGSELHGFVTITPRILPEQKHYRLRFLCPEGWHVECRQNLFTPALHSKFTDTAVSPFVIHAGEHVESVNRIILEITCSGRPTPILTSLQVMG